MSFPGWINTAGAEANFVVANTPNFLVRKMKDDPATSALAQALSSEELLRVFRGSAAKEPATLRELVIPYLCLSALARKESNASLVESTTVTPLPHYKWLPIYRQILVESYRSVSRQTMRAMPTQMPVRINTQTSTSVQTVRVQ